MRLWLRFSLVILVLMSALPVFAQKETGIVLGTVTNDEQPVPGATLTAAGPALIGGSTTTFTDKEGHYRFPLLPPGTYEIKAELKGFQTVTHNDVRVYVGKAATIDFNLQASATQELVQVSGETPTIDATTAAESKTVPLEQIENLPKSSFALDLFTLTPGIGDLSYVAYGAGGAAANGYWVDGVDVSNPFDGSVWVYPNYNWLQEVNVIGLGAPAEYGGFTGVVANSVTRSGSNQFHGLFETFFENDNLVSDNTGGQFTVPATIDNFTDNTIQLGGPVLKDKLWFFSGYQYQRTKDVPLGYTAIRNRSEPRWLNKLTYKINQSNTAQGFVEWDTINETGRYGDAFDPPPTTAIEHAPEWVYNSSWTSLLSPNSVLDVRANGFSAELNYLPVGGPNVPGHFEGETGVYSVNLKGTYLTHRTRFQVNSSLSHYAQNFIHGDHDFKFGMEYERDGARRRYYYNGGIFYYDYGGAPYYRYLWQGYDANSRINRVSTYAQDSWQMNSHIRVDLGVRLDVNRGSIVDQGNVFKTNPVAPRLGLVYDLKGNQKTIIKGHYGRYYDSLIASYFDSLGDYSTKFSEYFNPETQTWDPVSQTPKTLYGIDDHLKQPYVDQYVIGIDQALGKDITVSAHYIHRVSHDFLDDVNVTGVFVPVPFFDPVSGQTITVFNQLNPGDDSFFITNPAGLFRKYDGIEVYGGKRFSNKFNLTASFVWSRETANIDNTSGSNDGLTTLFDDPNYNIFIDGIPSYDPTYEIKLTGYYYLPWGFLTSGYFRHFTGDTWTTTFRVTGLDQGSRTIFAIPRGSNRLESRNVFDFRLEKAFPIFKGNLKATMDVFNVFNTGYVLDLATRYGPASFGEPTDFSTAREFRLGVRYQF